MENVKEYEENGKEEENEEKMKKEGGKWEM